MLGGPVSVVAVRFKILLSIPVLETVRLDLLQELLLPVLHLVGTFPVTGRVRIVNPGILQQQAAGSE